MNEKINGLWDQVKLQECDCGCNPDEFLRLKFAELIVRECDLYARQNWEHGLLLGGDLKRHFGVEE